MHCQINDVSCYFGKLCSQCCQIAVDENILHEFFDSVLWDSDHPAFIDTRRKGLVRSILYTLQLAAYYEWLYTIIR